MGRKLKRGQAGNAVQYLTRNQALKKLQLKLSEFRRLCILKGVHPREPKKKVQGQNKTYYHVKDINFLLHEPLLNKLREQHAYEKKIRKAKAKKNAELAQRLLTRRPTYRLDHLVKERYPSFVDALRDLDDPLTMVHLFATLPAEKGYGIPRKDVETARRLALEWGSYVVRTHALRKVYVSVKGFYYQAEVQGQTVTWLVPHQLAQILPPDVDYRVMLTFLEFYHTLLHFVNFKLYHGLGVRYPPIVDPRLEDAAAGLAAVMQQLAQAAGVKPSQPPQEAVAEPAAVQVEVQERLRTLPAKLRLLQQEAGGEGGAAQQQAAPQSDSDDDAELGVDSGADSDASDEVGEEVDDEDEEAAGGSGDEGAGEDEERAGGNSAAAEVAGARPAAGEEEGSGAAGTSGGALSADDDASICASLFSGLVFFLGREVPREQLLFVVRAFGGVAAWDGEGSPYTESDESITHQVVDRPQQGHRFLSREYVQPQWVLDSANFRVLVHPDKYRPGVPPPPHLSPFVKHDDEEYVPDYAKELLQLQEAAMAARRQARQAREGTFVGEAEEGAAPASEVAGDEGVDAEARYAEELARELKAAERAAAPAAAQESISDDEGSAHLQAELKQGPQQAGKRPRPSEAPLDEEVMKDIMMTRKTRKLYNAIQRTRSTKRAKVQALQAKRQALAEQL